LSHLNPDWFIFLVPAYPSCPGIDAVKTGVVVVVLAEIVFVKTFDGQTLPFLIYSKVSCRCLAAGLRRPDIRRERMHNEREKGGM